LYGHKAVIERLLSRRADPNWIGFKSQCTSVEIAAEAGHGAIVGLLLNAGADIKTAGSAALQRAAVTGHIEVVKTLLGNDATFDLRQDTCLITLKDVATNGYIKIVKLLVKEGQKNGSYRKALRNAGSKGDEVLVNLLLQTKPDEYNRGPTAPYSATGSQDQDEAIQRLIDHDTTSVGLTPTALQSAAGAGHELIVRLLLEKNAIVNTDSSQESPLQQASRNGHNGIVNLLLDKNAFIDALGPAGTALQLAAENGHEKTVALLLEKKVSVDASNDRGTPLQLAAAAGHEPIVFLLLENGANINASVGEGTALQRATLAKHEGIVELLIARGANVNTSGSGNPALQTAAAKGYKNIVRMLLKAQADLNAQSGSYGSALQAAVVEGKVGMVELLLEEDAKDFTAGGKKRWDRSTSSWIEIAQTPKLTLNETSLQTDDTSPILSSINQKSLLAQLAKINDNRRRLEASQWQIPQVQHSRSRTGSRARQPSISQLQEDYSRNPLSLQSMSERSPISSPRPMSPRPTSPIVANRLSAADARSRPESPV
jgi:ankyrin repeat protein